jgi:hypothetical protein
VTKNNPPRKPPRRLLERPRKISLSRPIWPGWERGTTTCRMAQGHPMMSLGMVLLQVGITQSSTLDALLTETISEASHRQSTMTQARSSTKGNKSTTHWLTMPGLQNAHRTTHSPPTKRQCGSQCTHKALWLTQPSTMTAKHGVMNLTTRGTRPKARSG